MNTKIKFIHIVFALVLALATLGISTSAALAAQPYKYEYTYNATSDLTGVCSFSVRVDATVNSTEIYFFDKSGALTRIYIHNVEQDTFIANGKTLVSLPYTVNIELLIDSSGNLTHVYAQGVAAKIILPDGSLFISAGRTDFITHTGETFVLSPDKGNPGNIAGFCAALAP